MKRIVTLFVTLFLLAGMFGCNEAQTSGTGTADKPAEKPNSATCEHVLSEATCTQAPRCSLCKRYVGRALGHDWHSGVCARCNAKDSLYKKTEGVLRVVCVGDSITRGGYWQNNLDGNLDSTYEVIGLGVNGATGLAAGIDQGSPLAYVDQSEYSVSLRYNPDAVVVMLGTNDTKGVNYNKIRADGGEQYKKDMIALIESYQALDAEPQIFLALPPTVYRTWTSEGINDRALEELLLELLRQIAAHTGATVIDTHTATAGQAELFPDGVHPNSDGKAVIARTVALAILEHFAR